jgi:hypothetical protein
MSWLLALIVKPLFLLLLFGSARLLAWGIVRVLPDGRFKRWLLTERGGF